jgi:hypothetical protein
MMIESNKEHEKLATPTSVVDEEVEKLALLQNWGAIY